MTTTPVFVRVSMSEPGALTPGRGARCRAMLHPPQGPMTPGAYDSASAAYFATIYEDSVGVRVERARSRDHKRAWDGLLTSSEVTGSAE